MHSNYDVTKLSTTGVKELRDETRKEERRAEQQGCLFFFSRWQVIKRWRAKNAKESETKQEWSKIADQCLRAVVCQIPTKLPTPFHIFVRLFSLIFFWTESLSREDMFTCSRSENILQALGGCQWMKTAQKELQSQIHWTIYLKQLMRHVPDAQSSESLELFPPTVQRPKKML